MNQPGVDDLAAARRLVLRQQLLLGLLENLVIGDCIGQSMTEQADRLGVRNAASIGQVQKAQEVATIQKLVRKRVFGHSAELLHN